MSEEKEEILAEIHRLIDEQLECLKGKLTALDAIEFRSRKRKIEELLDRISKDGFKA